MFRQKNFQVHGNPLERPDPSKPKGVGLTLKDTIQNALLYIKDNWMTKKNMFVSLIVFVYLILLYLAYFKYPSYFQDYSILINIVFVVGFLLLFLTIATLYIFKDDEKDKPSIFGYMKFSVIFFLVVGLGVWIIKKLVSDEMLSGFVGFFLNFFIVLGLLVLAYLGINNIPFIRRAKERGLFKLLYNIVFLIPCYIVEGIQKINTDFKSTPRFVVLLLFVELILITLYMLLPKAVNSYLLDDGIVLVKEPKYTDMFKIVANVEDLEEKTAEQPSYKYNYAITSWIFLHDQAPNLRETSNEFTSILNYGGKPDIQYNVEKQQLRVVMDVMNEVGDKEMKVIYTSKTGEFPLQKWNYVAINYSNGILDVFINGELVGTSKNTLSYMEFDTLTIGKENGVSGGISNIIYYRKPIPKTQISLHYNTFKNKYNPYI